MELLDSLSQAKYHCSMVKQKGVKTGLWMDDNSIDSRVMLMESMLALMTADLYQNALKVMLMEMLLEL